MRQGESTARWVEEPTREAVKYTSQRAWSGSLMIDCSCQGDVLSKSWKWISTFPTVPICVRLIHKNDKTLDAAAKNKENFTPGFTSELWCFQLVSGVCGSDCGTFPLIKQLCYSGTISCGQWCLSVFIFLHCQPVCTDVIWSWTHSWTDSTVNSWWKDEEVDDNST